MPSKQWFELPVGRRYDALVFPSIYVEEVLICDMKRAMSKVETETRRHVSGSSYNTALSLAKIFRQKVWISGLVAENDDDENRLFIEHGIDRSLIYLSLPFCERTAISRIVHDISGSVDLPTFNGIRGSVSAEDAKKKVGEITASSKPGVILATSINDSLFPLAEEAFSKTDAFRVLNLGPRTKSGVIEYASILSKTDLLIINHEELRLLIGQDVSIAEIKQALLLRIHALGVPFIIITCGKDEIIFSSQDDWFREPVISYGKKISSAGAGDAFTAGVVAGGLERKPIKECLEWGLKFAALKVRRLGGPNIPSRKEFERTFSGSL